MTANTDVHKRENGGTLGFILKRIKPYRTRFWLTMVLSSAGAIIALAPSLVIYGITQEMFSELPEQGRILILAAVGMLAIGVSMVLASSATVLGHKLAFALQSDLRHELLDVLPRAPMSEIEGRAATLKKTVLTDVGRLEGLLGHVLPDIAAGLSAPIAGSIVLAFVDWRLVLASFALLPIALIAQTWTWYGRKHVFAQWNEAEAQANTAMLSYVGGIATLKAFNRQASTLANISDTVFGIRDLAISITRRARFPYALFASSLSTNLAVVFCVALSLHNAGIIQLPEVIFACVLGAGLTAPLNKVVFAAMTVSRATVAIERIEAVLKTPILEDEIGELGFRDHSITFEKVGFSYGDGKPILDDINLQVPAGSMTAIVGPSGAGKSTLARLLCRFEDCTSGRITLGGVDIRQVSISELRREIGAVFQHGYLFHGSVGSNITMADPAASSSTLRSAVDGARLQSLGPDVIEKPVNDHGTVLSGGERQRVAIARVLLKDAPVLVLDEATAFLDPVNEAEVQQALVRAMSGRTVIMVAHRLATVRDADQIVVLVNGQIEACGRHNDLLASSATYKKLWEAQENARGWKLGLPGKGATA